MLTADEEWELIGQLRFAPEDAWLQTLYKCGSLPPQLRNRVEVRLTAEWSWMNCD